MSDFRLSSLKKWLMTAALGLALVLGQSPGAHADNPTSQPADEAAKARARELFQRGLALYKKHHYKDAIDSFLEADRLFPNPVLSFNTARAYDDLGDDAGALRFYRRYMRQSPSASDAAEVGKRIGELEKSLRGKGVQQVTIMSEPDGATVSIDGRPVGVTTWTGEIYPGKHKLRLTRDGYVESKTEFDLPAHRAIDVQVKLEQETAAPTPSESASAPPPPTVAAPPVTSSAPEPPPAPHESHGVKPLTFVVLGVAGASLAGAGIFEILRRNSESAARDEPTQVGRADKIDQEESRQKTARIFAGVGAVAAVAGGVLLVLDLSGGSSSSSEKKVGKLSGGCAPGGCGLSFGGSF